MEAQPDIIIENISKCYGETIALDNISFKVEHGELFGLIGPDGAGKSSLFRILTTLLIAEKGMAKVVGFDSVQDYDQIRKCVGYMPGRFSLYQDLTVEENLKFFATIFGTTVQENYALIEDIYVMLEPFKNRRASQLSGGMKQKLALCCALIHKPKVLFLDEPTTGVDPVSRKEFWEMLKRLKTKGITILVSTPYMDEARLCDRVGLIQNGKILSIDTPENIENAFKRELFSIQSTNMYALIKDLRTYEAMHSVFAFGKALHYTERNERADIAKLKRHLLGKGHEQLEISQIKPSIEDCFMELMR